MIHCWGLYISPSPCRVQAQLPASWLPWFMGIKRASLCSHLPPFVLHRHLHPHHTRPFSVGGHFVLDTILGYCTGFPLEFWGANNHSCPSSPHHFQISNLDSTVEHQGIKGGGERTLHPSAQSKTSHLPWNQAVSSLAGLKTQRHLIVTPCGANLSCMCSNLTVLQRISLKKVIFSFGLWRADTRQTLSIQLL